MTKFDKNWNYLSDVKIYGANTETPFRSSSLRCAESDGKLYIRTGHRMYKSADGLNHQANMTIIIDEATMKIENLACNVSNIGTGYVSHSFNQFIIVDANKNVVAFDHGDALPRGAILIRYGSRVENIALTNFAGDIGDNATGASIGGLAETDNYYVAAYTYDGEGGDANDYFGIVKPRSLYVAFTSKNNFSISGTKTVKVAESAGTPMLVPVDKNGGYIFWNEMEQDGQYFKPTGKICSASYDDSGNVNFIGVNEGQLSDCQPIIFNGKIIWYVTENSAPNFFDGEDYVPSIGDDVTLPAGISVSGATLTASTAFTGNKIDLENYSSTVTKVNASALSRGISIVGTAADNSLKGGSGADTISGGAGNDTVSLGSGNDVYIYSGGNDLIQDYTAGADKIKLASGSISGASVSGSNIILKIDSGNVTVKGAKDKSITVIDSAGKETSQIYPSVESNSDLTYDAKKTTVTLGSGFSGTLKAADYASTVKKIDASAVSKANIIGNAQANTIYGGSGNDKLYGEAGNDTLTGGDGKDVFVYANGDGADVIADFTAGQDSIKLTSGTIASASLKSSDVIFKIGSGSLTVKNGKGKEISVGSAIYYNNFAYDAKKTAVTLGSSFTGSLKAADYASTVKKIDASAVFKPINLVGNSQANIILGGSKAETIYGGTGNDSISGGAGNDKLYGEAGNDTLTGGDGKDVFVYANGDGKDVISDYAAGDTIKISSGSISGTSYSGNNVIFTVGNGSITVKNGKGKKITITDASNKTSTKTYSGAVTGSSALWFMEDDDNFTTNAAELSNAFRDSRSESALDNLSVRSDVVNLTAELETAAPIFSTPEKKSIS